MKPLALVIENDGGTRRLLDVLLTRFHLEVDLVASGSDALLLLERVEYDLILVDLLLPGMSGMEVLAWLDRERRHLLPRTVVVSSASPLQLERVRQAFPNVRVIRKPFELGDIVALADGTVTTRLPATPQEEFTRRSVRAGAKAGIVLRKEDVQLVPVMSFGYMPGTVEAFFPLFVDAPLPIATAARLGQPVWIASIAHASAAYPSLPAILERNQSRALAVVPLRHGDEVVGVAGWSFREPRLFAEGEQQLFVSIAATLADGLAPEGESVTADRT